VDAALHALASPRRREILRLAWRHEVAAGEIHRALGDVTFGAVSQHLRALERSGLLAARTAGRRRLYLARREALGPVGATLEAMWDDALYQLKLRAELDESRRGPRPRSPHTPRRRRPRPRAKGRP
jgi:DNA-binding transcriptional ArsR family regulator